MMSTKCIIVGAGELPTLPCLSGSELIVAADGGCEALMRHGTVPHAVIGDLDSQHAPLPLGVEIVRYPVEKDETDMHLAFLYGYERGCREFELYGGTGGRLDHTLANLSLMLAMVKRGCSACLFGNGYTARVLPAGRYETVAPKGSTVSVFAIGGSAEGVCVSGLKYSCCDAVLNEDFALGVSNSATGEQGIIEHKSGYLLVIEEV